MLPLSKIVNDRLAEGQKSIDKIVAVKGSRTIENTLVPYDRAIRQINTGNYLANMMFQVHPDAAFRDKASTMTRKGYRRFTALSLNRDVYKALSALDRIESRCEARAIT
jgi:thimet oligopeptidase